MKITLTYRVSKTYRRALNYWYHHDPTPAPRGLVEDHLEQHGDTLDTQIMARWNKR